MWGIAPSHSLRSAWIEITMINAVSWQIAVALLTECVDRNMRGGDKFWVFYVALLTECVDRNRAGRTRRATPLSSHSLRSAWIEIALKQQVKK